MLVLLSDIQDVSCFSCVLIMTFAQSIYKVYAIKTAHTNILFSVHIKLQFHLGIGNKQCEGSIHCHISVQTMGAVGQEIDYNS